jgi:hypothetical protein
MYFMYAVSHPSQNVTEIFDSCAYELYWCCVTA